MYPFHRMRCVILCVLKNYHIIILTSIIMNPAVVFDCFIHTFPYPMITALTMCRQVSLSPLSFADDKYTLVHTLLQYLHTSKTPLSQPNLPNPLRLKEKWRERLQGGGGGSRKHTFIISAERPPVNARIVFCRLFFLFFMSPTGFNNNNKSVLSQPTISYPSTHSPIRRHPAETLSDDFYARRTCYADHAAAVTLFISNKWNRPSTREYI